MERTTAREDPIYYSSIYMMSNLAHNKYNMCTHNAFFSSKISQLSFVFEMFYDELIFVLVKIKPCAIFVPDVCKFNMMRKLKFYYLTIDFLSPLLKSNIGILFSKKHFCRKTVKK